MDLFKIRSEIKIVFQPIHDLESGEILGFEALARGPGPLRSPNNFFRLASRERMLDTVEMLCFELAIKESCSLPGQGMIFFNFSPFTVMKHYREIAKNLGSLKNKAVIELIEYAVHEKSRPGLVSVLGELHQEGLKIALDDVGNGDRDFSDICELPADIMKIDRRLIQGLTRCKNGSAPRYQIILNTIVGLAKNCQCSLSRRELRQKNSMKE
ncbi:MAG: EAL domain-containing protein [Firmicutes bacterium]|nr:EAL domain-containing protein [Bacillota bacterium]